jgi:hypothetical protein
MPNTVHRTREDLSSLGNQKRWHLPSLHQYHASIVQQVSFPSTYHFVMVETPPHISEECQDPAQHTTIKVRKSVQVKKIIIKEIIILPSTQSFYIFSPRLSQTCRNAPSPLPVSISEKPHGLSTLVPIDNKHHNIHRIKVSH